MMAQAAKMPQLPASSHLKNGVIFIRSPFERHYSITGPRKTLLRPLELRLRRLRWLCPFLRSADSLSPGGRLTDRGEEVVEGDPVLDGRDPDVQVPDAEDVRVRQVEPVESEVA